MTGLKLVSAGDDIKIWDSRGFGWVKTLDPHDEYISKVCWSHCGTFLSSCSENDDKIALTHLNHTSATSLEIDVEKGNLCVDFNSNSRYLLYGGSNRIVNVWDLKTKKLKKSFKEHKSAITSLTFNWNDAYIASGSKSGDIILHNLITGQSSAPLKAPKVQTIKQLQYHYFRKSLFASASDDGAINLWDANTRQLKHSFNDVHKAPATGIAFSPINEMLLTSVGLDKRIALYDVQGKRNLRVLMADSPLTTVDVMPDGATLVVGTSRGKIIVYDIRKGSNPVQMFNAHNGPISTLSFHPKSDLSSVDGTKSDSKKLDIPVKSNSKSSVASNDTDMTITTTQSMKDKQHPITEDVFSPVRETPGYQDSASFTDDSCHHKSGVGNKGDNSSAGAFGVFSPLQGNVGNVAGKLSLGNSSLTNNSYNSSQGASSGVISPENGNYSSSSNSDSNINAFSGSGENQQRGISASPSLQQIRLQQTNSSNSFVSMDAPEGATSGSSTGKRVMFTDQNFEESTVRNMISKEITDYRQDLKNEIQGAWQESRSPQLQNSKVVASRSSEPSLFQTEFTRNLIREALEEFREEIHRDLTSLHVEMLRQFQMQQTEVMSMMEHLSLNKGLLTEVEQLREENKRLKKQF